MKIDDEIVDVVSALINNPEAQEAFPMTKTFVKLLMIEHGTTKLNPKNTEQRFKK